MRLLSCHSHIWIDSLRYQLWTTVHCWYLYHCGLWGSQLYRDVRCSVVNARWTTSKQKLLVLEPQWIKSYWKSKEASNSSCILLERDPCLRRATNSCNRSRASQTDGYSAATSKTISNIHIWTPWHWVSHRKCTKEKWLLLRQNKITVKIHRYGQQGPWLMPRMYCSLKAYCTTLSPPFCFSCSHIHHQMLPRP